MDSLTGSDILELYHLDVYPVMRDNGDTQLAFGCSRYVYGYRFQISTHSRLQQDKCAEQNSGVPNGKGQSCGPGKKLGAPVVKPTTAWPEQREKQDAKSKRKSANGGKNKSGNRLNAQPSEDGPHAHG